MKIIERENFDGSLAKRQIRQYFPLSKFPTIRYSITIIANKEIAIIANIALEYLNGA